MYLMYVDESGDSGLKNTPTRYFVLTGLVVHELRWVAYQQQLVDFRRRMKAAFGLRLRDEIHASAMLNRPGELVRIPRNDRLTILRSFARELSTMADIRLINVAVDKQGKRDDCDVFELAWRALVQRFENTISRRNFPGPANADERGILIPDRTDDRKLTSLLRQLRKYNPIPNQEGYGIGYRNLAVSRIIEDPHFKNSAQSYFVQACDLAAFLLYQSLAPSAYVRKKSAHNYFGILQPILCRVASPRDPLGVVHL